MKEIIAYEMEFTGPLPAACGLTCVPFQKKYWEEYKEIYNECFYEMRKALEVEPYHYYSDYAQMQTKAADTFLCLADGKIAGAVSCYGSELDDLIVNKPFRERGLGYGLLLWGISRIKGRGYDTVTLHVAQWNSRAVRLYERAGFRIRKIERVR